MQRARAEAFDQVRRLVRDVSLQDKDGAVPSVAHSFTNLDVFRIDRKADVGLPDMLRADLESLSGVPLDDVVVHRNSSQPGRIGAHAFATRGHIHLAPGQEQHLAHEAWHVVQQRQGRVRGNGFEPRIHDDPILEREADRMGARVSAAETHHFPPTPGESQRDGTRGGGVVQPKKVGTDFGEFETTRFTAANLRGVEIVLQFHPSEAMVDARKIALSQSVRAFKESGAAYVPHPSMANRVVAAGNPGAGYTVDASGETNNPIYFDTKNLGPTEELKDTPMSANTGTTPTQLGTNTHYELGYCFKANATDAAKQKKSAGLFDRPQGRKNVGAGMTFETAAFAIEGADKGKYYGAVKWGYKIEGTDAAPVVTKSDIERASKGTPTVNFLEAAKLWNASRTRGTLKVIADPATVYLMDGATTETLAKGTRVRQLDTIGGGAEPMIKVEVLNADGTGTGKLRLINVPDVKDMGDGSENKKLPV